MVLNFAEFDAKTGEPITNFNPQEATRSPRFKEVNHSRLEHWLTTHNITPLGLYTAKYYEGLTSFDRDRREKEGKVFVFGQGSVGYFTDPATAVLITQGDSERGIEPIFEYSTQSAHNLIAYGSLIASDGRAATTIKNSRILVIDDEGRFAGNRPIADKNGVEVPAAELEQLFDKMGDGTMLVSNKLVCSLLLDAEILEATSRVLGNEADPELAAKLLSEYRSSGKVTNYLVSSETANAINREIESTARVSVMQFRAATNWPGIAKGTLGSSAWCERLGLDAIVSTNDIKGDDGRLKSPGIHEVSELWVNRKTLAEWSMQSVGPQVKGTIPRATLAEFNPRMRSKAQALAEAAVDPWQLEAGAVLRGDRRQAPLIGSPEGLEAAPRNNRQTLHQVLKADKYGQLSQLPNIARQLQSDLREGWLDAALSGVEIPSAIAQHHSQLKPWEICNRNLPHGAVVAYYRSPFPNVGAAGIAVNNHSAIKDSDREAFDKRGVVYLNPWTAKNIAITDFDGDRNGIFVGYLGPSDFPEKLREQLSGLSQPSEQYEAGREAIAEAIKNSQLVTASFPLAVQEFVERNAPGQKPLAIAKAPKAPHVWDGQEPLAAASWRAWEVTANNLTGKVANQLMTLQSFALEMYYADPAIQPELLKSIAKAYSKISPEEIPTDEYLVAQNIPPLALGNRIQRVLAGANAMEKLPANQQLSHAQSCLLDARELVKNFCDSAVARNLQTAVDSAKSSTGIDQKIHDFGRALIYKQHLVRSNAKEQNVYITRPLPTNTQEPIGWAVESTNQLFTASRSNVSELSEEHINRRSRSLIPKEYNAEQAEIVAVFVEQYRSCTEAIKAARERRVRELPEDRQPTATITSGSGRQIDIQRLCDAGINSPLWDLSTDQINKVQISRHDSNTQEAYIAHLLSSNGSRKMIGFVSPDSAKANEIDKFHLHGQKHLSIADASIEFHPPRFLQDDLDQLFNAANQVLDDFIRQVPQQERFQYASALWGSSVGMGIATKIFPQEIADRLDQVPPIRLGKSTEIVESSIRHEVLLRFDYRSAEDRHQVISLIGEDGSIEALGENNYSESPLLPPGTVVKAEISRPLDSKIRIETDRGNFAVIPRSQLVDQRIEPVAVDLIFEPGGREINVCICSDRCQTPIGILDPTSAKAYRALGQNRPTQLTGSISRQPCHSIIEIHVRELVAHQPVARILAGEQLALPNYLKSQPALGEKAPGDQICSQYNPTMAELRALCLAQRAAGDRAGYLATEKIGLALAQTYVGEGKAPGGYRHPDVSISLQEKEQMDGLLNQLTTEASIGTTTVRTEGGNIERESDLRTSQLAR